MNIRRQQGPARGNLAPIIPALMTGEGGDLISPDEMTRRRAALAQRQAAARQPQQVTHWAQGAAMLVDAFSDASEGGRLRRAEEAATAEDQRLAAGLRDYYGGSGISPVAAALFGSPGGSSMPSGGSSAAPSVPSGELQGYVREGLISRGMPAHVADGFLPNFQDESGFNPGINEANPTVPGSRGGFGLYQLTGPRRVAYEGLAARRGVDPSDVDTQLDFLAAEMGMPGTGLEDQPFFGSESRAAQSIMAAPTTSAAAQAIVSNFLRPAETHRRSRMDRYSRLGDAAPIEVASLDPSSGMGRAQASATPSYTADEMRTMAAQRDPLAVPYEGPGQTFGPGDMEAMQDGTFGQLSLDTTMNAMAARQQPGNGQQIRPDIVQALVSPSPSAQGSPGGNGASQSIAQALVGGTPQPDPGMQRVAQALFNPQLLEAATSPYASDATRSIAQMLLQNEMQSRDPLRQLQIQAAQQEMARGQALINVGGGQLYNPNSGEWISAPGSGEGASVPDAFQTLQLRAQAAGLAPGSPEFQSFMANGGRSADDSAAEQRIGRLTENLMATGAILDPTEAYNLAVGMVDGRYQQGRDPITGNLQIVDTATGSVMFDGRNAQGGQGGQVAPGALPSDPAMAPAPAPSEFGERYPNAPESFGVAGAAQRAINTVGDAVGFGAPYPDVQQTQASFSVLRESLLNDVAGAYGRQPPSWLLQEIRGLTPEAGSPFQGAGGAVVKLQALGNHLQTELQLAQESSGRDMNPERRQALEEKIIGLEAGLGRIRQAISAFGPQEQAAPPTDEVQEFEEGATAINSETGERLIYRGGRWEQMQ